LATAKIKKTEGRIVIWIVHASTSKCSLVIEVIKDIKLFLGLHVTFQLES